MARRRGIQGAVVVELLVGTDGRADQVRIVSANPQGVFESSVQAAVLGWRFDPAIENGLPAPAWVRQTIHFRLQD